MRPGKFILLISIPLAMLVITVSFVGLSTPNFYSAETLNWQAQSIGQDVVNLFLIVPCLILTSILAYRNNKVATLMWGGVVLYLTYTFLLYCFDVHFNKLFVLYCFCLGLSFYSLLYFLLNSYTIKVSAVNNTITRFIGVYFLLLSVLFYLLWLVEIVPSILQGTIPQSTKDTGLFTNGVHVLDLSIVLPCIFLTGIFLIQRKVIGYILAPALLTFFILMDITIGSLVMIMKMKGLESNLILTAIMGALALLSIILLILYSRKIVTES